jgi:hypothetical protein
MMVNGKNLNLIEPAINDPNNWFYDPPENSHIGEGKLDLYTKGLVNEIAMQAFGRPAYPIKAATK